MPRRRGHAGVVLAEWEEEGGGQAGGLRTAGHAPTLLGKPAIEWPLENPGAGVRMTL